MSESLGANFGIDITNLKTGLTQANRLIRESESEFKAAAAGLDDWTKSEDGLNAKISSLNSITEIQRKKVSALKDEYKRLIDNGLDPASAEAVKLRTDINKEEAALKSNEKELKSQKEALKNLGKETEEAGKKYEKLGNMAKAAGKVAAAAVAAAGAAVVAITKQAIESYADYEQLVGGVETLFKDSGDTVMKYAQNAYKTAGMTANQYMETVTSFSASLLQSLGGDTDKAAKYADMAVTDMSDNANKMGSDIQSIQNAYGGFAKQNFTMLDNLKLGYGGTKSEMERLLKDAEKISGIKYDVSSYADIVDAIHVVQNEMGITGTTAKEASSTIQGSLASMKGAWSNVLTGLADADADLDGLIDKLVDSVGTVAKNILPRIKIVLKGIIKLVAGLLPEIPPLLNDMLPELITAVMGLIQGIVEVLPQVITAIMDILPQIITAITEMLPTIITAIIAVIIGIIGALSEALPEIVAAIIEIVPQLVDALLAELPTLLQAAITFLMAIIEAIPYIVQQLTVYLPQIINTIVNTLINNLPLIVQGAITLFMGIIQAIPEIINQLILELPFIIKTIVQGLLDGIPALIEAGKNMLKGMLEGLLDPKAILEGVKRLGESIVGGIKKFFGIASPSKLMENVIGKNLALGIGVGFDNNIADVNKQIQSALTMDDININAGVKTANTGDLKAQAGGVVVYQTNNYSQAHSRYEIYKSKQQTAAAVRLAMQGV